jgi:CRISPR-associated endonuclease Cas2
MWYVVTYDISDDDRRERLADLLGRRVQLSVFECRLEPADLRRVVAAAGAILEKPENGDVRIYRWCAACRDASTGLGDLESQDDEPVVIV